MGLLVMQPNGELFLERALKMKEAYFGRDHFEVAITLHVLRVGARHIMEGYEAARESCEEDIAD